MLGLNKTEMGVQELDMNFLRIKENFFFMFRYTRVKQDNAALTARIHMLEEHIREIEVGPFINIREIEVGPFITFREPFVNIREIDVGPFINKGGAVQKYQRNRGGVVHKYQRNIGGAVHKYQRNRGGAVHKYQRTIHYIRKIEVGPFIKSREIEVGLFINIRET